MELAVATIGALCVVAFGGHGPSGAAVATTRQLLSWGPSMQSSYAFRQWSRGIAMRRFSADIAEEKQAPAI
eukprot:5777262-Lingulodinium_polyedra.AAC.1